MILVFDFKCKSALITDIDIMAQAPERFTVEDLFLALGMGEQFPPIAVQDSLEKRYPKPYWEGVAPTFEEQNVIQPFHHHPAINLALELEVYDHRFTSTAENTDSPAGRKRKRKPSNLAHSKSLTTRSIPCPDHPLPNTNQIFVLEPTQVDERTKSRDRKEKARESKHWKKHHTKQRKAESKQSLGKGDHWNWY